MADMTSVDLARRVGEDLEQASPDVLRAMVQAFAEALMSAEADALCGAPYGVVSEDRVNRRNGYRERRWDTRAPGIGWRRKGTRARPPRSRLHGSSTAQADSSHQAGRGQRQPGWAGNSNAARTRIDRL